MHIGLSTKLMQIQRKKKKNPDKNQDSFVSAGENIFSAMEWGGGVSAKNIKAPPRLR